jgi:hypothetical protein
MHQRSQVMQACEQRRNQEVTHLQDIIRALHSQLEKESGNGGDGGGDANNTSATDTVHADNSKNGEMQGISLLPATKGSSTVRKSTFTTAEKLAPAASPWPSSASSVGSSTGMMSSESVSSISPPMQPRQLHQHRHQHRVMASTASPVSCASPVPSSTTEDCLTATTVTNPSKRLRISSNPGSTEPTATERDTCMKGQVVAANPRMVRARTAQGAAAVVS